jgi:xanthine/CO dehydrogenase XdhC/CoxF family maturation factor
MSELQQLISAWDLVEGRGGQAVLATLVKTSGSTYRRPGARMLMGEDRRLAGAISGGCLEGDLARKAWWHTSDGQATIVRYDSTSEDDEVRSGFGLGCNGTLDVLLERLLPGSDAHPLAFVRRCHAAREPGVMATVISSSLDGGVCVGERLMYRERGTIASTICDRALASSVEGDARAALATGESSHRVYGGGAIELFVEAILPPRPLVIFGNGFDVAPLLELAKQLGWHVTIVEARASPAARFAAADRILVAPASALEHVPLDARTAVVIMSHNYERDLAVLARALPSPAPYVGILGPRTRTERLLHDLARAGVPVTRRQRSRLHGPVGLDLGAEGPVEIALAIVAEVQAVLARRTGASLQEALPRPHALAAP